jgi:methionyl-tRNA formyltransferase
LSVTRLAFFGSPAFALPVLEALRQRFEVVLVVAQPDKPAGRGLKLTPPPVAARAHDLGLPLEQPAKLRKNLEFEALLRDSGAEVAVTCAYGKILPQSLLDVPPRGFLNVHTSLLPKYRGAAPIQWALIEGEAMTGVTIMQTQAGLDTGPILLQESLRIGPDETSLELAPRLSSLGARLIVDALERLDTLEPQAQDDSQATIARLLEKDDGRVTWTDSASAIYNRYRGVAGWPGSFFEVAGKRVKVLEMHPSPGSGASGTIISIADGVTVGAGEGTITLRVVQPEGKPRMNALDWARGYQVKQGAILE